VFDGIDIHVHDHFGDLRERREQIDHTVRVFDLAFGDHFPLSADNTLNDCYFFRESTYLFVRQHVDSPFGEVIFLLVNEQANKMVEN
jgi:hypothetical protein